MAKILIIGNSSSGHAAVAALVHKGGHEITVVSGEPFCAYRKELLLEYIAGTKKEKELFIAGDDFYRSNKIALIQDGEVVRLDAKRRRATLKDGAKLAFDYCVIASGTKVPLPDVPGKNKDGVFSWGTLRSAQAIKQRLDITHTACLMGDPLLCKSLAGILRAKSKEVRIIASPVPVDFAADEFVEWIDSLTVSEIIGEGVELRAIKLSNGKAIGTSLVVCTGPRLASTDFLKETDIALASGFVVVDNSMRTNHERVFACGNVACFQQSPVVNKDPSVAGAEGALAVTTILTELEGSQSLCQQKS
ncbi:MAG TPA: FAD-dependent oxidoreductase [Candidatus Omnitrophota bacterium]|nr:FAD-dependent oxidoreductase [Candidatus Omnitrophota bacterium]